MSLLSLSITIDGTAYDDAAQTAAGIVIEGWGWNLDADDDATFYEIGADSLHGVRPRWQNGQLVTIEESSTAVFSGEIVQVSQPFETQAGWTFRYAAKGLKYRASFVGLTATDGSGRIQYNMPPSSDDYVPALTGQTVGAIIAAVLASHSSALSAVGISTDATTTSQLAALADVPPETVTLFGSPVLDATATVLRQWARNVVQWITPGGKLRYLDTTSGLTATTLTEGTDYFGPFRFDCDTSGTYTRALVRGKGKIAAAFLRNALGYVVKAWDSTQQNAWKWSDFATPSDAYDKGTINSIVSATVVNVTSSNGSTTWATNFWPGRQAWLHVYNSGASGLQFSESVPVSACGSMSAGGNADITLGYPLENAGSGAYTTYEIVGRAGPLTGGSGNDRVDVWRLYNIVTPGNWIEQHLVRRFPTPVPFLGYYGDVATSTTAPSAQIVAPNGACLPASFTIDPVAGQIRFERPTCELFNSTAVLAKGGSGVVAPADIYAMLAYSRGALEAVYPPDSGGPVYAGQAYTALGLERTSQPIDMESWVYEGSRSQAVSFATMMHAANSSPVYSGNLALIGADSRFFQPGRSVSIAGDGYTTGQESAAVPVRSARFLLTQGEGGTLYRTTLSCSSRRNPRTGDRLVFQPIGVDKAVFKIATPGAVLDTRDLASAFTSGVNPLAAVAEQMQRMGL